MTRSLWTTHDEAAKEDRAYWRTRSVEERVAAVELIRQSTYVTSRGSTERMARLGNEPLRIDVMNNIDGVSFAVAWRGRTESTVDGLALLDE